MEPILIAAATKSVNLASQDVKTAMATLSAVSAWLDSLLLICMGSNSLKVDQTSQHATLVQKTVMPAT
jgi:hypothetical protein